MTNIVQNYTGHRQRLRERFLKSPESLPDYEIVEMMLFASVPRKDVKDLAKKLIKEIGDINAILNSNPERLLSVSGVNEAIYTNFRLYKEVLDRSLKSNFLNKNILGSWSSLVSYLQGSQGAATTERLRVLYLNKKNHLIADELQDVGTIDQTPVYPREVLKRIIFHNASAIILVHNHPSGSPDPSSADVALTKEIMKACDTIGVVLHDHVIVCKDQFYSFRSNLLL
ncbi:MAG: hypothetical protein RLZZ59_911 [Pseudomonadota bacterium]|jgi:DNA repair protein RadC